MQACEIVRWVVYLGSERRGRRQLDAKDCDQESAGPRLRSPNPTASPGLPAEAAEVKLPMCRGIARLRSR
jgi:hypothetical protein